MTTISLRLPDSLHNQVRELAKNDGISFNQFATSAIAEKMAALMTKDYLDERAARGSREKFAAALSKVSAAPPDAFDALDG